MTNLPEEELTPELAEKKCTDLQKAFAKHRSKGLSQAKSAELAGSRASNMEHAGWQLEQIPHVRVYTEFLKRQNLLAEGLDKRDVIRMIIELYEVAKLRGNASAMVAALNMLGASEGIFKSVSEIKTTNTTTLRKGESEEDLNQELGALLQEVFKKGKKPQLAANNT